MRLNRINRETRHRQTCSNILRIAPDVDKFLEPRVVDLHTSMASRSRPGLRLLKLLQEANVVLIKKANIIESVHESAHAIDTKPKREARKLLGIDFNFT